MKIKIKNIISQLFCFHSYKTFLKPIDRETNPYGFMPLSDENETIDVCVKCGKARD